MPVPEVTPTELAAQLASAEPPKLVDVRTPGEHALVALPGALLLPLDELLDREDEVEALVGKEVVVYCHHGIRSLDGAAFLLSRGVRARSLRGGIDLYALQVDPRLPRY